MKSWECTLKSLYSTFYNGCVPVERGAWKYVSRNDVKLNGQSQGESLPFARVPFFTRLSSRSPATCKLNYFGFMSVRDIALFTEPPLRQLVGGGKRWRKKKWKCQVRSTGGHLRWKIEKKRQNGGKETGGNTKERLGEMGRRWNI